MHEGQVELGADEVASAIAGQFSDFAGLPVVARRLLVLTDSLVAGENVRGEQQHAVILTERIR